MLILLTLLVSACAGVSFTKAGEEDANSACSALVNLQGEDISASQFIAGLLTVEVFSAKAAAANDDYAPLDSAVRAFNDSLYVGSEALATGAWANVARICNAQ